ncbi:MAG TPA: PQQ-dependent sugar dehydrogenase [Flexivirga sp.]|uniref:PQQ-dependent sugar dehydrogenase n=1 Tax=Flexivirga sp. TaxID=1962927 RepID=UPI002BE1BD87|nr:PQQ-dependent sugar dehydrogenase [Flexivirga sp.]HWC24494.1 PQQ-dependent sugar dehydrogenase [Flexivirga sp.]
MTDVVTGLAAPWSVVWVDGIPLISQRDDAHIRQLADGELRDVLTVPGVKHGGEGGLLGMAVRDGWLVVYYTADDDTNHVARYPCSARGGRVRLTGRQQLLDGIPAGVVHNGGRVEFGPDGKLYVSTGDSTKRELAQDRGSLAGKILRMEPDGRVPEDNPFPNSRVWSMGHRNVQGMAWAADHTMFAVEFGENTWDELNGIVPGGNYGWPLYEGRSKTGFDTSLVPHDTQPAKYRNPVQQWPTSEASPSGMAILGGTIYIAALGGQRLITVPVAHPTTSKEFFVRTYGRLRDVVVAPDKSLWVLTNNTDTRGDPRPGDDRILRVAPDAFR